MITADRFIAQSRYRDEWLGARDITATTVAKAATPAGFVSVMAGTTVEDNEFMEFGRDNEHDILRTAHRMGIPESDWLIAHESNPRHQATPDGLSPDHQWIAEAKTTGTDWRTIPIQYRRQVQFQLYVTGAQRCLFLWQLRLVNDLGGFYAPWLDPKTLWIERDEEMIADLVKVAEDLENAGYGNR